MFPEETPRTVRANAGHHGEQESAFARGQRRFDWPRFWVAQGGPINLSDGGYLLDPVWEATWAGGTELYTLPELSHLRVLALLGEPGMGKSVALETEARREREGAEGRGVTAIHANLRTFSSDHLLYSKVFESPEFRSWKEGTGELVLHLDSLDEALLRIETVAALIADELPRLPVERLSLRVACRTLVWPAAALMPVFRNLWGAEAVGAYEIAPLRRIDVREAASRWPADADVFLEQVRIANAVPFAIKPLTLNLLLRLFQTDGGLPDSIAELYQRGCLSLCEEQSPDRRAPRRDGRLTPPERLRVASRVAAVSMLANRYALWTGLESGPVPQEDVALSALAVGSEPCESRRIEVKREDLREVLDTGLFSSRGDSRMGWAHQSYAEHLAAHYLISRKVPKRNVLDVLRHPSGGLVPQLAMVAAWAASLDKEIRRELIEREPVILLYGDLAGWDESDLGALTEALLSGLDQDRVHDFALGLNDRYRKLAHFGLAAILRPYIADPARSVVARRVAIRIAEACSLRDLREDLLTLAIDQEADAHIRACAVSALETCGDESTGAALKPLALDAPGSDPYNDIKGNALKIVWPEHLDGEELFQHITAPRESYFGVYADFLTRTLPETLKRQDLPAALIWATDFVRGTNHMGDFQRKKLADAILRLAWDYVRDPEISPLVLAYVQVAIAAQYELFVGIDRETNDVFRKRVAEDVEGRRAFLTAALVTRHDKIFAFSLVRSGLLVRDDLGWLLCLSPGAERMADDVEETTLHDFVQASLDLSDEGHFAALYNAAERWPLLRSTYTGLLDGVPLDSPMAEQLKSYHLVAHEPTDRQHPDVDPPPAERVRECLDRFEAGDVHAWWQMNRQLTLTLESAHYGSDFEYRIASFPGWVETDEATRDRILAAALAFLERAESMVDQWIDTNQPKYSDLAAYRSLVLLREFLPDAYRGLDAALWRKWAPLVVAVPRETGTEASKLHDAIAADATAVAPAEIATTVLSLVRSEKRRRRSAEQTQPEGLPSFMFFGQISPTQENAHLVRGLLDELADDQNAPQQFAAILEFLLQAKVGAAREYALHLFEIWPCATERRPTALSAAAVLLEHDSVAAWSRLWPVIAADADFGRELFLRVAQHHRIEAGLFAGLPEDQLGALYVWLEQTFPHSDDPDHDGAHWMGPRDSVIHLRDGVLNVLVNRGTPEAVAALRSVIARLPNPRWLAFHLMEADQIMRQRTWLPLTPTEVLRLVESPDGRLVQSAEQLAEVLTAALRKYERQLHGEQTPVRALWDRQGGGALMRPVEEDALTDHVKLFLQGELVERGIVLNREVEIGRVSGAPIGTRTDIRVNATRKTENAESFDAITAVVETKGCWNRDLMTAIETQLHDDYLTRLGAPVGIYLVGWFDKAKWDSADGRRARSPAWDAAEAQHQLDQEAARLTGKFLVRAVVLDCHAS
jgi:hypothetical protein